MMTAPNHQLPATGKQTSAADLNPELVRLEIVKAVLDPTNTTFSEVTEEQRLGIARIEALNYAFKSKVKSHDGSDKEIGGLPMTMQFVHSYIEHGRIVDRKVASELVAMLRQRGGGNYKSPWIFEEEEQQGIVAKIFSMFSGKNKQSSR